MKLHCWEKLHGRQPGGERSVEFGICPVSVEAKTHMIHEGINGGRACWAIQRKFNGNDLQCKLDQKLDHSIQCDFYSEVKGEEGSDYLPVTEN